ncbi:MAG: Flp family type IVb pilin [Planctomycetota bacterium]
MRSRSRSVRHSAAAPSRRIDRARHRQRGAVALEYILIAAIVAIGLIVSFRLWGKVTAAAVSRTAVDSSGALVKEP